MYWCKSLKIAHDMKTIEKWEYFKFQILIKFFSLIFGKLKMI